MIRFLTVFLSLYSAMHALFYFRVRTLLPDRRGAHALLILFLILMILAPIASRFLERNGNELPARLLAIVGFNWTGFIFLAFWGALGLLALDIGIRGLNHFCRLELPLLNGRLPALVLIGGVVLLCLYGWFEARNIRRETLRIVTDKLPAGTRRLKIVQISDVHLGLMAGTGMLQEIVAKIRHEKPDLLVCTGDLIDGRSGNLMQSAKLLQQIHCPLGKFAVTGNHEVHAGIDRALAILREAGFRVLRNEVLDVGGIIDIAGVDDARTGRDIQEERVLAAAQKGRFLLFLKHRPLVSDQTLGLFDLQLSGHTHGGQIFPFRYFVGWQYPLPTGYVALAKQSALYTSRGTGTWGPRMRILSPPEITVVELVRKEAGNKGLRTPG